MKSLWRDEEVDGLKDDLLSIRVYTSRLLGKEADLVLHGGGNTSVKLREKNLFGDLEELLFVKGSGWDLATIEKEGFAPVRMDELLRMVELKKLSDTDMVRAQRAAMTDPNAPNPSVEAILHAVIPFRFVDHTHADAVVTLSNTPNGRQIIQELYGDDCLIIPYVMPGFLLAKEVNRLTEDVDWNRYRGMILLNHGVFTFHEDARVSYKLMIELVSRAERYLEEKQATNFATTEPKSADLVQLATIRKLAGELYGGPVLARLDQRPTSVGFSGLKELDRISQQGPVTPDHIIRTKRVPILITKDPDADFQSFRKAYETYFNTHKSGDQQMLDPMPRWGVWPDNGLLYFASKEKDLQIISDIVDHTIKCIQQAEQIEKWKALSEAELFEMEYWELEQAKLKKAGIMGGFQGKVALVTGAASGIGRATAEALMAASVAVIALDVDPLVTELFPTGIACDLTDRNATLAAIREGVLKYGGLDLLVSNAGFFPESRKIEQMDESIWQRSMEVNLESHRLLLQACLPYLERGFDPAVVVVGSRNVTAPGPGAAAYSVAKAALTQFMRIAALEWGEKGIRVNAIHPDAVYDTGIWSEEVLQTRAANYGLSVEAYKRRNVLKKSLTSTDVAELVLAVLGPAFKGTTGAQIPVDGGSDRVI